MNTEIRNIFALTDSPDHTRDSISLRGAGVVTVVQPKKGARFSLDSLLLADFCRIRPGDRVLEPGAGSGVVSLLLAKKHPRTHITAVEIQPSAAKSCRRNILENSLADRITLIEQDLRSLRPLHRPSALDVIVANPPYHKAGAGKQSPSAERLSSRHDRLGSIDSWLDLQVFLKNKGRYVIVFPADRLAELSTLLRARKIEPKRLRFVHPRRDKNASLLLLEAVKSAGPGLLVLPPMLIHDGDNRYSSEMRALYGVFEPPAVLS